jgi:hypothetical protein
MIHRLTLGGSRRRGNHKKAFARIDSIVELQAANHALSRSCEVV